MDDVRSNLITILVNVIHIKLFSEKIGFKIRDARLKRVPYLLVVGQKEEEEGKVSVRSRYLGDEGQKDLEVFIDDICKEIRKKEIREIQVEAETCK